MGQQKAFPNGGCSKTPSTHKSACARAPQQPKKPRAAHRVLNKLLHGISVVEKSVCLLDPPVDGTVQISRADLGEVMRLPQLSGFRSVHNNPPGDNQSKSFRPRERVITWQSNVSNRGFSPAVMNHRPVKSLVSNFLTREHSGGTG